jgi:hypothetical protein
MLLRHCLRSFAALCPRRPRGAGFLVGGLSAALLVFTLTAASIVLSGATGGMASGEVGHCRLPRAALSLGLPFAPSAARIAS